MDKKLIFQMFATEDGLELKLEQGDNWAKQFEPAIELHGLSDVRWRCETALQNLADSIDEVLVKHCLGDEKGVL